MPSTAMHSELFGSSKKRMNWHDLFYVGAQHMLNNCCLICQLVNMNVIFFNHYKNVIVNIASVGSFFYRWIYCISE